MFNSPTYRVVISSLPFLMSLSALVTDDIFLRMPPVKPRNNQTYLCTSFEMPRNDHIFVVDFLPYNYTGMDHGAIHHVLLYGCTLPGYSERDSPEAVWNCGDRPDPEIGVMADACQEGTQLLSSFNHVKGVPEGITFKVGQGTELNYIVLQLHFGNVNAIHKDADYEAGMLLKTLPSTTKEEVKVAGTYFMGTEGEIPPNSVVRMESSCLINELFSITPFSYSTHTHGLGLQVAAYLKKQDEGKWYRLAISQPPGNTNYKALVNKTIPTIAKGDVIASRCIMYNSRNYTVVVGFDTMQEMCNFYLNYYMDGGQTMQDKYCYTDGPPKYYWSQEEYMQDLPQWIEDDVHLVDEQLELRRKLSQGQHL